MKHKIKHFLMFCLITVLILNSLTFPVASYGKRTMYDTFSAEEIGMLEVAVQHEVGGLSKDYKTLIAELIYNRIVSDEFPGTVEDVLFQEGQFPGISQWYSLKYEVDSETKAVVKEVFSKNETSHSALYYYNPDLSSYQAVLWFEYSGDVDFLFEYSETAGV